MIETLLHMLWVPHIPMVAWECAGTFLTGVAGSVGASVLLVLHHNKQTERRYERSKVPK